MNSSKVLIVDHHAIHSTGRALYKALAALPQFEVRVLTPRAWKEYGVTSRFEMPVPNDRPAFVPSRLMFGGKTHRNLYCSLQRELRTFRPDILFMNSEPEGFLAAQAVLLSRLLRLKPALVFTTWRNMPYGDPGVPFPVKWPWLSSLVEGYVLPRAAHGIALSPSAEAVFRAKGFNAITYIPPWIDQELFFPAPETGEDGVRGGGRLHIGYVGRFVPEKGVAMLLDGVAASGIPATITLAGDGPLVSELERRARDLAPRVCIQILRSVPHEQVPGIMRRFDLLALMSTGRPGWTEQFGRVLMEAMACGVPVIGSSNGAIPAVIGNAGIVVPAGDVAALADALRSLYEHPAERARLAEAGLRRVNTEFSVPSVARKYAELFTALLDSRQSFVNMTKFS